MPAFVSTIFAKTGTDTRVSLSSDDEAALRGGSMGAFRMNLAIPLLVCLAGLTPLVLSVKTDATTGTTKTSVAQIVPFDCDVEAVAAGGETSGGSAATMIVEYDENLDGTYTDLTTAALDIHTAIGKASSMSIDAAKRRLLGGGKIRSSVTATGGTVVGATATVWVRRI